MISPYIQLRQKATLYLKIGSSSENRCRLRFQQASTLVGVMFGNQHEYLKFAFSILMAASQF